jgi:hypothetical protein
MDNDPDPKREIRADGKRSEDANLGVVAELAFKRLHEIESSACCSASRFPAPWCLGGLSPAPWCPRETHGSLEGRAHLLAAAAASRESRWMCSYSASAPPARQHGHLHPAARPPRTILLRDASPSRRVVLVWGMRGLEGLSPLGRGEEARRHGEASRLGKRRRRGGR